MRLSEWAKMSLTYQFWGFSGSLGPSQSTISVSGFFRPESADAPAPAWAFSTSRAHELSGGDSLTSSPDLGDMVLIFCFDTHFSAELSIESLEQGS
jgi:hypothetical protein